MRRIPTIAATQWFCTATLIASLLWFAVCSIHWPLTGDASLMHYIVFLADHGLRPYHDIADMNLPGAYLPDWMVIHVLGPSAFAWRLYDFALLLLAGIAMLLLTRRLVTSWHAGIWAAALFALVHGRDGLYQSGQRDLTVAVLLLCATAALLSRPTRPHLWTTFFFGLAVGAATLIKPTAAAFLLLAIPLLCYVADAFQHSAAVALGAALPLAAGAIWLTQLKMMAAFWEVQRTLTVYHASLGRRPLPYLLVHSLSPILPLFLVWLLLSVAARPPKSDVQSLRRKTLLLGAALGLLTYILQGKGYPYHRYSLLAFLLPQMAVDFDDLRHRQSGMRWLGAVAFTLSSLFIGVTSAWTISRFEWQNQPFRTALRSDLEGLAPSQTTQALSAKIQCLDTVGGCLATLYDLQLVQSTGTLYDEFLFHAPETTAVRSSRERFWRQIQADPPAVFVVTAALFPDGAAHYEKLAMWPEFRVWLNKHYVLNRQRDFTRPLRHGGAATVPSGYRLYTRCAVEGCPTIPSR